MLIPDFSDVPFVIRTPIGDLDFNGDEDQLYRYVLIKEGCRVGASVRATVDNIPQASGEIHHPRAQEGVGMVLQTEFWSHGERACGQVLQTMCDNLMAHLVALLNADDGRVLWTPEGFGQRMITQARWLEGVQPSWDGSMLRVSFAIDSPFPYAISALQAAPVISGSGTVTNGGNTDFKPVLQLAGPFTTAEIVNESVVDENGDPLRIVYDGSRPGAAAIGSGNILEIDTFKDSAYLGIGGPPGDDSNRKAGIDLGQSDFFPIAPGANTITADVPTTFLVNDAYAA